MHVLRGATGVLVTLVVLAAGLSATPATAYGGGGASGTLKVTDNVTNATACVAEVVEFVPAADLVDWTVGVSFDTIFSTESRLPTITLSAAHPKSVLTMCPGRDPAGAYWAWGYLTGTRSAPDPGGGTYQVDEYYQASFHFRVIDRKPTAWTVRVARSHSESCPLRRTKHCSRVAGRLTRAGRPFEARVELQVRQRGRWRRVSSSSTDQLGRITWWVVIEKKERNFKFRLYFPTRDSAQGSVSRKFKVRY